MASTPRISILVCGRTGVGKSSLINYILGKDVCKVGDPVDYIDNPQEAFQRGTATVKGFNGDMNGVMVTVYDSPGLQDGTCSDHLYLDDMYKKCRDVDLVIYCHDITEARWTGSEITSIDLITRRFGATIWNKTILALTKANLLKPAKCGVSEKKYLEDVAKVTEGKFKEELRKVFQAIDQPDGDSDSPPAVLTGSEREQELPTGLFVGKIWLNCVKQLRLDKVNSFIKATNSRSRIVLHNDIKRASQAGLLEYIPTKEDLTEAWKVMMGRRKERSLATSDDEEEPQYFISLDKEKQEQLLEKLTDSLAAQGNKASEGMLMDSINELVALVKAQKLQ